MNIVKIPFRPFFSEPMRSGRKVMTCRSKRMGIPGDKFEAFGCTFMLTHVFRCRLGYVISDAYEQEGCKDPEQLEGIWADIHPGKGVDPNAIVWAHCFRQVGPSVAVM